MKKTHFIGACLAMASLVFQACNQDLESPESSVLPSEIASCNCSLEQYSPQPGKLEHFGEGPSAVTLANYDGMRVLEGDIILTEKQIAMMAATFSGEGASGRIKGAGQAHLANRWPGGVVPYVINPSLPNTTRVTLAITHWEGLTDYDFVPRTTQANYVEFVPSTGCASYIGMIGGQQYIFLASGCTTGNTIHEIGHAVGLWHEHTRADRDYSVNINWANITSGAEHNFELYNLEGSSGFDNGAFDFGSIMMYPSDAFSSNGNPTITKKDGTTFTAQRSALSSGDISAASYIYSAVDLPAPTNIYAYHDGDETLTVTWDAVAGADEYWIYAIVWQINGPEIYRITTATSWTRELKLNQRNQSYYWVAARDDSGNTSVAAEADYSWR